jgi:cell division protein FtsB
MVKDNATENAAVRIPPALAVTAVIILSLALAVVMLYPVLREYYVALRVNAHAHAEYEAVVDRNEKIQQQIDELSTLEGIEDRAREEFGWVRAGEEAVNITGLDVSDSSTGLPSAIEPGSVKAPGTWLTETLDEFFGVADAIPASPDPDDPIPAP